MENVFDYQLKTIEACDFCGCFKAVTVEDTFSGDVVFICNECYPMFAHSFDREPKLKKKSKKFKWEEI